MDDEGVVDRNVVHKRFKAVGHMIQASAKTLRRGNLGRILIMQIRRSLVGLFALTMFFAMPAGAQNLATDDATARADLSDLRAHLFELVDHFNHTHAGRGDIEAIMSVSFTDGTDPAKKDDWKTANDLFVKGYKHLDFNQYYNPAPRSPLANGAGTAVTPTYMGEFATVPFDQDGANCLSLHEFRERLMARGWTQGESRIYNKHAPDGKVYSTSRVEFVHSHVELDLTVRGAWSGLNVSPALAATVEKDKINDCLVRVELTDVGS